MPTLKMRLRVESSVGDLPTLSGVIRDLGSFTQNPNASISEISEHISCDPSLSVRLLRIVNSAYYARAEPVVSIDEAVLFLGVEQIRMLSLTTRCVETMSPQDKFGFDWQDFWRHCIATAYFSCMLGRFFQRTNYHPELDYMSGLLHDVGKLVIAMLSPDGFGYILDKTREKKISFYEVEQSYCDTDHGALGGWYLERQKLAPMVSEAVRCHHQWMLAVRNPEIAALVNVADFLARASAVGNSGNMEPVAGSFMETPSWKYLIGKLTLKEELGHVDEKINEESVRLGLLVDNLLPGKKSSSQSTILSS